MSGWPQNLIIATQLAAVRVDEKVCPNIARYEERLAAKRAQHEQERAPQAARPTSARTGPCNCGR